MAFGMHFATFAGVGIGRRCAYLYSDMIRGQLLQDAVLYTLTHISIRPERLLRPHFTGVHKTNS